MLLGFIYLTIIEMGLVTSRLPYIEPYDNKIEVFNLAFTYSILIVL